MTNNEFLISELEEMKEDFKKLDTTNLSFYVNTVMECSGGDINIEYGVDGMCRNIVSLEGNKKLLLLRLDSIINAVRQNSCNR